MWNNPLQSFVIAITAVAAISLSACNDSKQSTVEKVASGISAEEPVAEAPNKTSDTDLDGATVDKGIPVKYDVSAWNGEAVKTISIDELDSIQSTFGKIVATDENSLDYASNPATKYRFMSTEAPYLDVIDSQKYLEVGWYYANPTDSDEEKELSKTHAKKAYKMSRQLMGDDGSKVLSEMLSGQIIKNQTIGGQKIELAKCEFYSCMLVFNKAAATASMS